MKAKDFEFDGKKLSDFGFIICNFSSKGLETISNGGQSTFNTVSTLDGKKHRKVSVKYEDCAEDVIQVCKTPCHGNVMEISDSEFREMTRWLGRNKFLKFKKLEQAYIDLYFEVRFKISKIEIDGILYGLELEVESNAPFALKEPKIINIENTVESVLYVWEKYKAVRNYEITKSDITESKPSNCDDTTYANYKITNDVCFELYGNSARGGYCYLTENSTSVSYVWKKYKVIKTYEIAKSDSTESKPNDCDDTTYADYKITNDGFFELSGNSARSGYCYLGGQIANAKSIYKKDWHYVVQGDDYYTYQLWTLGNTVTVKKGDFIEYVSSENRDTYPDDGVNGEYWYVYEKTEVVQNSGQTANAKSIYKKDWHYVVQGDDYYTYQLWTLGNTATVKKGDFIERVLSENRNAYPNDGIDGEYWYVYEKTEVVYKDIFINDTSHEEGFIYPHTEITVLEDGDLNIHNAMEDRNTYIANCVAGEIITMDYPIITSSIPSHNIQNDFNWCFFRVANTYENSKNVLTISIPCTMKVKYSPIVKVGL